MPDPDPDVEPDLGAHPIDGMTWRPWSDLEANDWNPNRADPRELDLLEVSIIEDGWTQPIVVSAAQDDDEGRWAIVDGFHRWTVAQRPNVEALTGGLVPTVLLAHHGRSARQDATWRHNRARGRHRIALTAQLVAERLDAGDTLEDLAAAWGATVAELTRLADHSLAPDRHGGTPWSDAADLDPQP